MKPERISFRFPQRTGLLVLLLFTFVAGAFSQSMADVARQERQRQRALETKAVVKSNNLTPPTATATPAATTPAAADATAKAATAPAADKETAEQTPAKKAGEVTDRNGHDEKFWRNAFQKARDDAKRAEARVELFDLKVKQINTDMLQYSNFYNRENILGAELTAAQKNLEDAKKEADAARKKLIDLEDELRKAGGPAGWAR